MKAERELKTKGLTVLASTVLAVALLVTTVMPAVAALHKASRAQFPAMLEQLTEEGVISPEQAETIMARTRQLSRVQHAYRQKVREQARVQSRPISVRISEVLGIKADKLVYQLRESKTIAEIAEQQGISTSVVMDELLALPEDGLDRAVAHGSLSQEQAREKLGRAEAKISKMVHEDTLKDIEILRKHKGATQTRLLLYQV